MGGMGILGRGVVLGALVILASACGGAESPALTLPPTTGTTAPAVGETTVTEAPSTTRGPSAEEQAIGVWSRLITEVAARPAADGSTGGTAPTLAAPDVEQQLDGIFVGEFARQATPNPVATALDDATVEIQDCIILDNGITEFPSVWFSGTVEAGADDTWSVTAVNVESLIGCVPVAIAERALADYENFWDQRHAYLDPPDPAASELDATTTGERRAGLQELAETLRADGQVLRGRPTTHPEFFELRSATMVVIADCQLADPARGVYDATTGERTDIIAPITEGETHGVQTTLELEDGIWKVSDIQAVRPIDCEFAPTPLGLPVVP